MAGKRRKAPHYNALIDDSVALTAEQEFARRLTTRMNEKNWNQSDLARRCSALLPKPIKGQKQGLTFGRDLVSHYCRGVNLPRPAYLRVLARALDCTESDLMPFDKVPRVEREEFVMKNIGGGQVWVSLARKMSSKTASKLVELLMGDEQ